jgi:hypothetical protein
LGSQNAPVDSTLDARHGAHEQLAIFLLEKGANPNLNGAGRTALHSAVQRDMPDLYRYGSSLSPAYKVGAGSFAGGFRTGIHEYLKDLRLQSIHR